MRAFRQGTPTWPRTAQLYAASIWTVFGLALSNILLAVTLISWALSPRRLGMVGSRLRALFVPAMLYAFLLVLSVVFSRRPQASFAETSELLSLAVLGLAPLLVRGPAMVRRVLDGVVVVAGGSALWGLGQLFLGWGDIDQRIRGPFSHYMTFAGILLLADCILLAQLMSRRSRARSARARWRWAAVVVINVALFASLTRSAWVALVVVLTLSLWMRKPRWLLGLVPAGVLFIVLAPVPVLQRAVSIFDLTDESNYDRLCMVEAGMQMVADRPLLGVGPRMASEYYPIYRHPTAPRHWVPHLHNTWLQLAAERGLPSVAVYLWLMAVSGGRAVGAFRRGGRFAGEESDLYVAVILGLLAFNVAGLFECNWQDTEVQRIVLFLVAAPFCLLSRGETQVGVQDE